MKIIEDMKSNHARAYKIVALGSSNTELSWHSGGRHNWVDWLNISLRTHIGKHINTVNQGICGERTDQMIERLDRDVFSYSPDIVIVTSGGNDIAQGYSIEHYSKSIQEIIDRLRDRGIVPVLQTYYCPIFSETPEGFEKAFLEFVKENRSVATQNNLTLIDQFETFEPLYRQSEEEYKKIMTDAMHVNYLGNLIMGKIANKTFGMPDFDAPEDIKEEWRIWNERI